MDQNSSVSAVALCRFARYHSYLVFALGHAGPAKIPCTTLPDSRSPLIWLEKLGDLDIP